MSVDTKETKTPSPPRLFAEAKALSECLFQTYLDQSDTKVAIQYETKGEEKDAPLDMAYYQTLGPRILHLNQEDRVDWTDDLPGIDNLKCDKLREILVTSAREIDASLPAEYEQEGSTLVATVCTPDKDAPRTFDFTTVSSGDSKAYLITVGAEEKNRAVKIQQLNPKQHNPGPSAPDPEYRPDGAYKLFLTDSNTRLARCAMYNCVGDHSFSAHHMICKPDSNTTKVTIPEGGYAILINCSDGVTQGLTEEQGREFVQHVVQARLASFQNPIQAAELASLLEQKTRDTPRPIFGNNNYHAEDNISTVVRIIHPNDNNSSLTTVYDGHGDPHVAEELRKKYIPKVQKAIYLEELTRLNRVQEKETFLETTAELDDVPLSETAQNEFKESTTKTLFEIETQRLDLEAKIHHATFDENDRKAYIDILDTQVQCGVLSNGMRTYLLGKVNIELALRSGVITPEEYFNRQLAFFDRSFLENKISAKLFNRLRHVILNQQYQQNYITSSEANANSYKYAQDQLLKLYQQYPQNLNYTVKRLFAFAEEYDCKTAEDQRLYVSNYLISEFKAKQIDTTSCITLLDAVFQRWASKTDISENERKKQFDEYILQQRELLEDINDKRWKRPTLIFFATLFVALAVIFALAPIIHTMPQPNFAIAKFLYNLGDVIDLGTSIFISGLMALASIAFCYYAYSNWRSSLEVEINDEYNNAPTGLSPAAANLVAASNPTTIAHPNPNTENNSDEPDPSSYFDSPRQ